MKKVIIADDIQAILDKEDCFLNRSGIRIFTTRTNSEALALHKAERADLIIAKLDMPEMTGERLCSLIRDEPGLCNVSIILICPGSKTDLEQCAHCSANAFITTPINRAVLLQEAYRLLHIAPRTSCRVPIRLKMSGESKTVNFSGHAENISSSGMLFQTDAVLYEGDMITCSFSLPDSRRISANAEIVRVIEKAIQSDINLYGITFAEPTKNATSAIEAFVDERCHDMEMS